MTKYEILSNSLRGLRDYSGDTFDYDDMDGIIDQVVREISIKAPLRKRANLAIIEYTKEVDLSPLTYLDIVQIEYPVGNASLNGDLYGTNLALNLTSAPTITDGTLTGTVTFTINSRSVTGAATLFTTELSDGYLICKSSGTKYYQIAEIVSATALTLVEPFEEASGADTINVTKYRDTASCVRVIYDGQYTVTTTSDMPIMYDEVAILGTVAHAATEYAAGYAATKLTGVTTSLASASTAAVLTSARVTQAIADLVTDRANLATALGLCTTTLTEVETSVDAVDTKLAAAVALIPTIDADFATTMTDVETAFDRITTDLTSGRAVVPTIDAGFATALTAADAALAQIITDLTAGRAVVDTINRGGKIAVDYADYGRVDAEEAKARIEKARTYLDKVKEFNVQFSTYADYAKTSSEEGRARVDKAKAYLDKVRTFNENVTAYNELIKANVDATRARIEKARTYLEQAKANHDYIDTAAQELAAGNTYLTQAKSHIDQAEQSINSAQLISSLRTWANQKWQEYLFELQGISKVRSKTYTR